MSSSGKKPMQDSLFKQRQLPTSRCLIVVGMCSSNCLGGRPENTKNTYSLGSKTDPRKKKKTLSVQRMGVIVVVVMID